MKTQFLFCLLINFYALQAEECPGLLDPADSTHFKKEDNQEDSGNFKGLDIYDSIKAFNGVTMLDEEDEGVTIIDMYGNILKKIPVGLIKISKDKTLVGTTKKALLKMDGDCNIIWKSSWSERSRKCHHDIETDDNDNIYTLSTDEHFLLGKRIRFDAVNIYSKDGKIIYQWKLYDHLTQFLSIISKSPWLNDLPLKFGQCPSAEEYIMQCPERFFIPGAPPEDTIHSVFEFSHFNSIQILPENSISSVIKEFKKGNILLSFNPYSCYGILDTASGNIVWVGYLPERTTLHTPQLTPQGTILVYQNSTPAMLWDMESNKFEPWRKIIDSLKSSTTGTRCQEQKSRLWVSITEYDPLTNQKVWEFTGGPNDTLQATFSGSAQRLPNGNTLICVAQNEKGGVVMEVNTKKEIVWQFISPLKDSKTGQPWSYYRARRISFDEAREIIPEMK